MRRVFRIAGTTPLAVAWLAAAPAASAAEGGLVLLPDPSMLLILVAIMAAMIFPVNALILKPIFRVLDEREDKIAGTRRRADKLAEDADEVLQRYEQAIAEARQESESDRKQTIEAARSSSVSSTATARTEAEGQVARAREEMGVALDDARSVLREQSEDLAREVASRALGRVLS